jgi:hypothetical protein
MVFVASLWFSVIVSRQRQQIERLIEETAILSAELREVRASAARREMRRAGERGDPENIEDDDHASLPRRPLA